MELRHIGKKADLSLSINAIVVLILAITMLGLGLAFLRGTFKKTTEQFAEVSGTVKEQITEEIKSKGEKLFIRGAPEIDVRKGETKEVFYGIKNVNPVSSTFNIKAECTAAITPANCVTSPCTNVVLATLGSSRVGSGEFSVLPLEVKVDSNAAPDTYQCCMILDTATPAGCKAEPLTTQYSRSDFYIKVSTS